MTTTHAVSPTVNQSAASRLTPPGIPGRKTVLLFSLLLASAAASDAAVRLPAVLSDHMVVQREVPLRVWGWADPGEEVTVTFGGREARAAADAEGRWKLELPAFPASDDPRPMTVAGKNTLVLQDILVGDVWVCSGQSNMGRQVGESHTGARDLPQAADPLLRTFRLAEKTAPSPQEDVALVNREKWLPSSPESVKSFSAVGYYFGKKIREETGIPIGLISSAHGGSAAQLWISLDEMEKHAGGDPDFQSWVERTQKMIRDYPERSKGYAEARAAWDASVKKWVEEVLKSPEFTEAMSQWEVAKKQALSEGKVPPPKPQPSPARPVVPEPPDYGPHVTFLAGTLYNGMIAPLVPFAIKGVAWYQGESNDYNGRQYGKLLPILIQNWRNKWGVGDFPFLFVQLPNIDKPQAVPMPEKDRWPALREGQAQALALPNTGMAVTIDVGDPFDVHGADKYDPGSRLALVALKQVYGRNIVASGPVFDSLKIEGGKALVAFRNGGGGLEIGVPPWTPSGRIPAPAATVKGFVIAGEDRKWAWAEGKIAGDTVEVSSPEVPHPVAVRYGWANNPPCNLYNKEKLPAAPFRSDTW